MDETCPSASLRILYLEDDPLDRELAAKALGAEGLACDFIYAQTQSEFLAALKAGNFHLIFSDFTLPSYNGMAALATARKVRPEAPFIFVSGTIGEERAIASLKSGATDYVLKGHLNQLGPTVRRALREAELAQARREAEEKLRASEQRYRLLFNSGSDSVFVHGGANEDGLPGKFIEVNDVACQQLGYTREELLAMSPADIDAPGTIATIPAIMQELAAQPRAFWEGVHVTKAGNRIPVEMSNRLFEMDGKPMHLSMARDITERKGAEAALRHAQDLVESLIQTAEFIFMQLDTAGNVQRFNKAAEAITGYTLAEIEGKNWSLLVPQAQSANAWEEFFRITLRGGVPGVLENPIVTKQGEERLILWKNGVLREGNNIAGTISFGIDITERKQAEAELRWKTAFLEAEVNSSLDGILVVNSEGKKILQNQRMIQLWKIPPEIASGIDDRKELQFVMEKVKNPQAFAEKVEYLYAHPDEVSRDEIELTDGTILDRYSSPVVGQDGFSYGRIWTFRDITEQKRVEAQLRQSQKMEAIGQLAGGVAHDFNNMLAVIRGNADLLLRAGDQLDAETRHGLNQVVAAAERAASLTRQLLMFSRKQVMQSQPLALNDLIRNLVKMLQRVIREDIRLECVYGNPSSFVEADTGMIEQVLLNLVVNARDAMPHGGQVRITTEEGAVRGKPEARAGEFVCLSVSDTGTGIAPEHLLRIFEPFFTTKEPGKGTGLGLATVYGIVKQHQGWIEVSSQLGKGTTFKVFLPAIPPPATGAAGQLAEPKVRGGTETILLVEDDLSVRRVTRRVLESYGYTVCEASCGREALEVWGRQQGEIALLLSDIVMPEELTGRDLAEQMRAQKPGLRVVLMSGYSPEVLSKGAEFLRRSKTCFLQKPCATSTLVQTVRQCLDE